MCLYILQTLGDYRPNITCESLEVIGELMPVNITEDGLEIHSEMLKLIGSYTQHYNAKTRSNAFNTMVINKDLMYFVFIFLYFYTVLVRYYDYRGPHMRYH